MDNNLTTPTTKLPHVSEYDVDPLTGFITFNRSDTFSAAKKLDFLRVYRTNFNKTKSINSVGVSIDALNKHLKFDHAFAKEVAQIKYSVQDELVSKARKVALKDSGVRDRWELIDRIGGEWTKKDQSPTRELKITIESKTLEDYSARQKIFDAEIVEHPSTDVSLTSDKN